MNNNNLITNTFKTLLCLSITIGAFMPLSADAHNTNNRSKSKKRAAKAVATTKTVKTAKTPKKVVTETVKTDDYAEAQISPDEATTAALKANKYRFEKSNLENIQELFGYDISQKDTMRISGFWLSQMRYSIPENLWKIFPQGTYASKSSNVELKNMDATQRFPLGNRYEGFVLTQHDNPENFYMLFYDKNAEKFVGGTQPVGAEYSRGIMQYKTVSYLTENAMQQPVLTVCTRSTRNDDENCTDNCFSHYRIEVLTFKNGDWVSQSAMEQPNDGSKASYDIDCGEPALKKQLQSSIQSIFAHYVPKFIEAGEFRNTIMATPSTVSPEFR